MEMILKYDPTNHLMLNDWDILLIEKVLDYLIKPFPKVNYLTIHNFNHPFRKMIKYFEEYGIIIEITKNDVWGKWGKRGKMINYFDPVDYDFVVLFNVPKFNEKDDQQPHFCRSLRSQSSGSLLGTKYHIKSKLDIKILVKPHFDKMESMRLEVASKYDPSDHLELSILDVTYIEIILNKIKTTNIITKDDIDIDKYEVPNSYTFEKPIKYFKEYGVIVNDYYKSLMIWWKILYHLQYMDAHRSDVGKHHPFFTISFDETIYGQKHSKDLKDSEENMLKNKTL